MLHEGVELNLEYIMPYVVTILGLNSREFRYTLYTFVSRISYSYFVFRISVS